MMHWMFLKNWRMVLAVGGLMAWPASASINVMAEQQARQLLRIEREVTANLPRLLGHLTEYDIWNTYPGYVGSSGDGDGVVISSLTSQPIRWDELIGVELLLTHSTLSRPIRSSLVMDGFSWGDGMKLMFILSRASAARLVQISLAGFDQRTGHLRVLTKDDHHAEVIRAALHVLKVRPDLVDISTGELVWN